MKKLQALLPVALLVAGCSSNFTMPWEANLLDPARIQTREPLELPPDLNVLPTPDNPAGEALSQPKAPPAQSATTILFNAPTGRRGSPQPLTRNEKEKLPDWIAPKGPR